MKTIQLTEHEAEILYTLVSAEIECQADMHHAAQGEVSADDEKYIADLDALAEKL